MFSKISAFTHLAAATKFATGEFVIDPRGDFSLMLAEKGWASQKEFDIIWHFLDQRLNAFKKHLDSIKRAVDPSREFDKSRLGGFRLASVPHTTFTDPESVKRAWSTEIRPTHESTRKMLGWELNSQCEPAVNEVTFIHQRQQLPIELPVPWPSINVAAAMLRRDEGTVPITDHPRESYTLHDPKKDLDYTEFVQGLKGRKTEVDGWMDGWIHFRVCNRAYRHMPYYSDSGEKSVENIRM
ncbi:uncharacterized protein EI90DRAFT_3011627 [Cantharellus anzutake]|uniref:uncharacterized protein n=1 Tax=Cantharellus anzutake TaxID=1750568 RepID=UPI0019062756|nr:uncharacterized protein EI90DRAFT_3011627 [Cantharellus anzutake]KAF8342072.1 hypothetical protein EI90DRAFT_3011627 [Cantharellus anzutake]